MPEESKPSNKTAEMKPSDSSNKPDIDEFEWLQYQDQGDQKGRIVESLLQNPFVPLGAVATVLALTLGLYNMKMQNHAKQQFYMRARVGAQGFTIASLIGGLFYQSHKRDSENYERLQAKTQHQKTPEEKPKP